MPIDPAMAAVAVSRGLSAICATCEKYWRARDKGMPDNRCLAERACGGPMSGNVFQEYEGPLPHFDELCFVCGREPTHAIRVGRYVRVLACCDDHLDYVKNLKPSSKEAARIIIKSKNGEELVDESTPPPPLTLRFK